MDLDGLVLVRKETRRLFEINGPRPEVGVL